MYFIYSQWKLYDASIILLKEWTNIDLKKHYNCVKIINKIWCVKVERTWKFHCYSQRKYIKNGILSGLPQAPKMESFVAVFTG